MADILEEIVAHKRIELALFKEALPERDIHQLVERHIEQHPHVPSMRQALMKAPVGIIAEFKRKSPSKGWINQAAQATDIPLAYQQNGAAALSILTDEMYFGGNDKFVRQAREAGVKIPVLYKNFVIDEYQLFQARLCGASAVLLIAADLKKAQCKTLLHIAHELQLEVLLEMHSEHETQYAELEPDMCGINNRNLGTFVTDAQNSFRLASRLPTNSCKVSESGISQPETVKALQLAGFNGFLMGERFMATPQPGQALKLFIDAVKGNAAIGNA